MLALLSHFVLLSPPFQPLSHISPSFTCLSFFLIINTCCCLTFHLSCVLLFFFIIVMCTAVLHFIFIVCLCFSLFALHLSAVHNHVFLPPLQYPHAGLCDNCMGHCFPSMSLPLFGRLNGESAARAVYI